MKRLAIITLTLLCILTLASGYAMAGADKKAAPKPKPKPPAQTYQPLGVYDGNDVLLGYFYGGAIEEIGQLYIYDPDVPGAFKVGYLGSIAVSGHHTCTYESADCSGQIYVCKTNPFLIYKMVPPEGEFYYILDMSGPPLTDAQVGSFRHPDGSCRASVYPGGAQLIPIYYPIKEVDFPLADTTPALPITIRPIK